MLLELTITDFAIIDLLHLRFGPHLNVFTGETGAGKSIIVDAISALVGERVGGDVVRAGSERAIVEGIFDISRLLAREKVTALPSNPRATMTDTSPSNSNSCSSTQCSRLMLVNALSSSAALLIRTWPFPS